MDSHGATFRYINVYSRRRFSIFSWTCYVEDLEGPHDDDLLTPGISYRRATSTRCKQLRLSRISGCTADARQCCFHKSVRKSVMSRPVGFLGLWTVGDSSDAPETLVFVEGPSASRR